MNGIDVSHHQGTIKWPMTGVDFAIIRSSHGKHETDRCFEANYAGARKAGIPIGAYHYFYYGNKKAFDEEVQNFLNHLKGKHFELPVFLDFEEEGKEYDPPLGAIDRVTLTNWAIEAFEKIRAAGYRPGKAYIDNFIGQTAAATPCRAVITEARDLYIQNPAGGPSAAGESYNQYLEYLAEG